MPQMSADEPDKSKSLPIEPGRENWLRLVRNRKQRQRYGPAHLRRRRDFGRRLERGEIISCFRRGEEIGPDQDWDLDNDDRIRHTAIRPTAAVTELPHMGT